MTDSNDLTDQSSGYGRSLSLAQMDRATFEQWMENLSNWGRWGSDDQLGTLNLIGSEKRLKASSLIKDGTAVSMERDVTVLPEFSHHNDFEMIPHSFPEHSPDCQGETWRFNYHGVQQTHLDSLAHMFYNGKMYNGFPWTTVPSPYLGVERMKDGIVTRGVLIDIPKLRAIPYLEPGSIVYREELDAWLKHIGLQIESGDALFIRTGRWAYRSLEGPGVNPDLNLSGLDLGCTAWLKDHDISILGCDFPNELCNSEVEKNWLNHAPFHILTIAAMGLPLIDSCDLERLAEECDKRQRWDFFFVAAPIAVPGATGSPINPIAVF